jgi:ornithine decarboxylase
MPFYAVKSNPDVNILRALTMLGAGFDVASEAELAAVKALGANSDDMIFANPCKGKVSFDFLFISFFFLFSFLSTN